VWLRYPWRLRNYYSIEGRKLPRAIEAGYREDSAGSNFVEIYQAKRLTATLAHLGLIIVQDSDKLNAFTAVNLQ